MAYYLMQVVGTTETWAAMVQQQPDRTPAIEVAVRALGGKVEQLWFCLGDYQMVGVAQLPDNLSVAAFSMAVAAGGACKVVKTTPLLTMQEGIEAMKKAAVLPYQPIAKASRS
jgi:uncharacterized protein with GYD domain